MGLIKFFDKLEDKTRYRLSKLPILYAIIGGIGIVLFWRGVWHTADYLMLRYVYVKFEGSSIDLSEAIWWDGPLSFLIGTVLLLMSGLFVSNFIGNEIIISGLRREKKLAEKTSDEVKTEMGALGTVNNRASKWKK
ncbi:MAG TPA: hypothetical protein VI937_03195 [Negativicutes bacterium]|nr:hypothetical protein [Negativicutes bacterium]